MKNWIELPDSRKLVIFNQVSARLNLPVESIEKDFYVVVVLRAIFSMEIAEHLIFKGGTSLSKCWNFMNRFSEDIDIAMDRELIGYGGELSNTKRKTLRKKSSAYVSNDFKQMLENSLKEMGFGDDELTIEAEINPDHASDRDPQRLFVFYKSVVTKSGYLKDRVVVEVGSRSQLDPFENRTLNSMIADVFPAGSFIQSPLELRVISPARTFLEKLILLHEEIQKPKELIRSHRITRHLYDIERLMDTEYGTSALSDSSLFNSIIAHRKLYTPIKGVDYDNLKMSDLNFLPPPHLRSQWEADYKSMREIMFYGESLEFEKLIIRLRELKEKLANT